MLTADCRTGADPFGAQECLRLLVSHGVGRVAVIVDGRPMIFAVHHHVVDQETIVFRNDELSKVADTGTGVAMSLEVDGIDDAGELWSVTASGRGFEVIEPAELARLEDLGLGPSGSHTRWIEMRPESVAGHWLE